MFSCAYASLTHCTVLHTCLCAHKNESTCCADQQMHHGWDSVCVCVLANVSACMLVHMCLWVSAHGCKCVCMPKHACDYSEPSPWLCVLRNIEISQGCLFAGRLFQLGIQNRSLVPPSPFIPPLSPLTPWHPDELSWQWLPVCAENRGMKNRMRKKRWWVPTSQ